MSKEKFTFKSGPNSIFETNKCCSETFLETERKTPGLRHAALVKV